MTSYATANVSSTDATNTTTTTTTGERQQHNQQQQHQHHQQQQQHATTASPTSYATDSNAATTATRTTKLATGIANTAMQQAQQHHHHHHQHQHHNQQQYNSQLQQDHLSDCDCDSLSDGREKADTTPENIKKIDDIIELELERERTKRQQRINSSSGSAMNDINRVVVGVVTDTGIGIGADASATTIAGYSGVHGGINVGAGIDLAAVIDDSNTKFCFFKKKPALCIEKEARLMESSSNAVTPSSPISKAKDSQQHFESPNQSSADTTTATTPTALTAASTDIAFDDSSSASNTTTTTTNTAATAATTTTAQEESETDGNSSKKSCAFTFSFNNNDTNAAATAARYKSVMERFQSRHRRGASMSKLENDNGGMDVGGGGGNATMSSSLTGEGLSLSSSASASPLTLRNASKSLQKTTNIATDIAEESMASKVKLRPRDRSTSRVRDAAKRHSWSPRSSTNEMSAAPPLQTHSRHNETTQRPPTSARRSTTAVKSKPPPPPPLVLPKGRANLVANRTQQFTPRSTAMQLALQKIDFLCPQAPLAEYKHADGDGDDVSEAGTYTLDGDNYTEEQKDLMNIDKNARSARKQHKREHHLKHNVSISPTSAQRTLEHDLVSSAGLTATSTKIPVRTSNVLEVNYFHSDADDAGHDDYYAPTRLKASNAAGDFMLSNHQSAGAYLEKIKSRVLRNFSGNVKNINSTTTSNASEGIHLPLNDDEDVGCFTSVTTSGVLAKQGALDPRPKLRRKNSLTTSQIDSSEYVSNEVKLKSAPSANQGGSYTDIQKAEYRLNLFTNQKDLHKYAATRNLIETPPETPCATTDKLPSDTAALTMAQSKNDWIQQWARNARARSLASETACAGGVSKLQQQQQQQKANAMTRSYNCGTSVGGGGGGGGSLTDDSLYSHQLNARYRMPGASDNEFDYSSDPSLLTSVAYAKSHDQDGSGNASVKPPKSPSKIPSPLHSIGRTRSASRTRGSLQGLITAHDDEDDGEDIYLQKTAAAINTLQQSLSRKNSIKSPTGSMASPRMNSARNQLALQANEDADSPQRSIESDGYPTRHRRNLSNESYNIAATAAQVQAQAQLMTSSFNEQQLQLLTSGEYLIKQMRMRKNSFDGNICSPRRRIERAPENAISPLHRVGSFSMKMANSSSGGSSQQQRAARPQYQNIYTPPAARQGYVQQQQQQQQLQSQQMAQILMKKSASSNNFGQAYSDYDDNLEYYINDADDDIGVDLNIEDEDELEYGDYEYGDANEEYGPRTITLHAATIEDTPAPAPLTSTRYNKALLMRIERSKQRAAAASGTSGTNSKPNSAPAGTKNALSNVAGLVACPNTPELPRRNVKSAPRASIGNARQSVPRDTSLSRLASQVPNSLASAKRQLLQTAAAGVPLTSRSVSVGSNVNQRVQPKYMDISKYKPAQGNAFLRKNESKSTLKAPSTSSVPIESGGGIRRSPSSSGISRVDTTRASNRSIRSAMTSSCTGAIGGGGSTSGNISGNVTRASSAVRRDDSVNKQKEIEMAMWKRRSTYDPLKAAAEDRRRKEEAKRLAMSKNTNEVLCERQSRSHFRRGQF